MSRGVCLVTHLRCLGTHLRKRYTPEPTHTLITFISLNFVNERDTIAHIFRAMNEAMIEVGPGILADGSYHEERKLI